jgi:Zn-dependent protease
MNDMLYTLSIWALPILLAVTFHEASHGFVAWRLGDSTAYQLGRVTFNPIKHIDLFGKIGRAHV